MENILDITEETTEEVKYAGFWIRVIAAVIDVVIGRIASTLVSIMIISKLSFTIPIYASYFSGLVIIILLYPLMESSSYQATIGKLLVGIKVIRENGEKISLNKALVRLFWKASSAITLGLFFIMAAFDTKKQTLHDKLAYTCVVFKNSTKI